MFWLNLTVCGMPRGQTSTHFVDSDMQPIRKWGGESKIKTVMAQTESPCPSCLHDFSFCRLFSANSNPQTLATASSLSTMFVYSRVMFNSERSCEIPSSDMNECVFCVMCWLCHVAAHHTLRSNLLHLWFFSFPAIWVGGLRFRKSADNFKILQCEPGFSCFYDVICLLPYIKLTSMFSCVLL